MAKDSIYTKPITGFPEWLPEEQLVEQRFLNTIRHTFEKFGFVPIETPSVERDATLESKGEINKQVYSLFRPNVPEDVEKETGLSLRFDLTVPLARYVAQHYGKLVFPFRRYQIQKVWRGERPQKGRFREFYQCDIDIIGDGALDLLADAEMPAIIYETFAALDIGEFVIRISNRKILQGLLAHHNVSGEAAEETLRAVDRLPKLKGGWPDLAAWLESELSLDKKLIEGLEQVVTCGVGSSTKLEEISKLGIENPLFQDGIRELAEVFEHLASLGVPENVVEVDLSITRGLDYYTGTVYETFLVGHEQTLGSICSGGRYDNLASSFTDRLLPGVGMSIGLTRLFSCLLESGAIKPGPSSPADVMVTVPDREHLADCLSIAHTLREAGLLVELFGQPMKHDKQMKATVRKGIPVAVIPWPEKLQDLDSVEIRDLIAGDRKTVPRAEIVSVVGAILGE